MKTTLNLGEIDYNGRGRKNCKVTLEIELKTKKADVAPYLDIDLKPVPSEITELSICGNVWNPGETDIYSGGQNVDTIREYFPTGKVRRICDIWEKYHLNGMNAGTREQIEALKDFSTEDRLNYYSRECEFLAERNLLTVPIPEESRESFSYQRDRDGNLPTAYKFGSAWLYAAIPEGILAELKELIAELSK